MPASRAGTLGHTALLACEREYRRGWGKKAVSGAGISSLLPLWSLFLLLGLSLDADGHHGTATSEMPSFLSSMALGGSA